MLVVPCLYGASVDVKNQMLEVRHIGYQSAVALSSPMLQTTADVPMSDIIIGLTLATHDLSLLADTVVILKLFCQTNNVGPCIRHCRSPK